MLVQWCPTGRYFIPSCERGLMRLPLVMPNHLFLPVLSLLAARLAHADDFYNTVLDDVRAKREGELVAKGASASEAAMKADKELTANEDSQQEKLAATLATEK